MTGGKEVCEAAALQLAGRGSGELRDALHVRRHRSANEALPAVRCQLMAELCI